MKKNRKNYVDVTTIHRKKNFLHVWFISDITIEIDRYKSCMILRTFVWKCHRWLFGWIVLEVSFKTCKSHVVFKITWTIICVVKVVFKTPLPILMIFWKDIRFLIILKLKILVIRILCATERSRSLDSKWNCIFLLRTLLLYG